MTNIPQPAAPLAQPEPRIYVRDETDVRVLLLALSLFSAHTHSDVLGATAESLSEAIAALPSGVGYSSRHAPAVTGAQIPERS